MGVESNALHFINIQIFGHTVAVNIYLVPFG